ncbi:MAG: type IV pilus secretin PilQ [Desulfuromonas thiophila]|nr:type IV pilus secretin PilQ [Desulfuromonas thiophila]
MGVRTVMRKMGLSRRLSGVLAGMLSVAMMAGVVMAASGRIDSVQVGVQSVSLLVSGAGVTFSTQTLGAPARLVVDVEGALPTFTQRQFAIDGGFSAVRVGLYPNKTRFVFDARGTLPAARVFQEGGEIVVDWADGAKGVVPAPGTPATVTQVDFGSGQGMSQLLVTLEGNAELIPPRRDGDRILFGVRPAVISRSLRRVIDASAFPSAVRQIVPYGSQPGQQRNVMFAAELKGPVEYSVALEGNQLVFRTQDGPFAEVVTPDEQRPVVVPTIPGSTGAGLDAVFDSLSEPATRVPSIAGVIGAQEEPEKVYTGEPVSMTFSDAELRDVMAILHEISGKNFILDEGVSGSLTLSLQDVPWDQALDTILELKNLKMIQKGNIVHIMTEKQHFSRETEKLKARQDIKRYEETRTEIFSVSYKDTDTLEDVIDDILSDQGEVKVIEGSKKIMVNDIPSKLAEVRDLLRVLDEPVPQVMIEARIVEMRETEGMDLGVNWGFSYNNDVKTKDINNSYTLTDSAGNKYEFSKVRTDGIETVTTSQTDSAGNKNSSTDTSLIGIGTNTLNDMAMGLGGAFLLPTTLGTSGLGGVLNFGRVGLDSTIINLRLSALEASGKAKVISSPKIMTLDGEAAKIEQGTAIPYQSVSDQGTTTEFEDATLSLEVTPEVNPDDTVILQIKASNSTIGSTVATGAGSAPSIDTKEAETKLLLKDGETTVIGGIYVEAEYNNNTGTPYLKDIPFLGRLFESNSDSRERNELLIFITPHIVK